MLSEEQIRATTDKEIREMSDAELTELVSSGQDLLNLMAKDLSQIVGIQTWGSFEAALSTELSDYYWKQEIREDPSLRGRLAIGRQIQLRGGIVLAAVNTAMVQRMERAHEQSAREYRREAGIPER